MKGCRDVSLSAIVHWLQQVAMDPWILAPRGPSADRRPWNSLPDDMKSATSLTTLRQKTENLFILEIISIHCFLNCITIVVTIGYFIPDSL